MLLRSVRGIPLALIFVIFFLSFFGWQLCQGSYHESSSVLTAQNEEARKKPLRVALMTFVTEQRSYLHLSLKNKDRKFSLPYEETSSLMQS